MLASRVALLVATLAVQVWPACAETYHKDAVFEISGTGARNWRRCTVQFFPKQTLGDAQAPRLQLTTGGLDKLSIGLDNAVQLQDAEFIQNNVRKAFASLPDTHVGQVKVSDLWSALSSQKVFFVTAKSAESSKYVSSRYEGINTESLLAKLEEYCPFYAEALMGDISRRERAEQALSLSAADVKYLRWSLGKRYGGLTSEPAFRGALGADDRDYLKRYYAEHGLPVSQFLTAQTYRVLRAEGVRAEELARPRWNAVAAALWRGPGGVAKVAIGYSGIRDTSAEASASALNQCRSAGGVNCELKGGTPANSGCIFITLGTSAKGAAWYSRSSSEDAVQACREAGYACQTPLGGCLN